MLDPLLWAETFLYAPETGEPFVANHVERCILGAPSLRTVVRVPRRRGKTYGVVARILHRVLTKKGFEVIITGPQEDHVDGPMRLIQEFVQASPLLSGYEIKTNSKPFLTISFPQMAEHGGPPSKIMGITSGQAGNSPGLKLRGQRAHMLFVDEAAYVEPGVWTALEPIMQGNQYITNVEVVLASTPSGLRNRYYDYCTDSRWGWDQVHLPLPDIQDKDITPEFLENMRRQVSEQTWVTEYLCQFPDADVNVFRHSDIDNAQKDYTYSKEPLPPGSKIAIGVDWDKMQAGVNIVVAAIIPNFQGVKLIYREEVPRMDMTLTRGVERVIALNDLFKPDHIFIDRGGGGEGNAELLHLHGQKNPHTKLDKIVEAIYFKQNVKILDPVTLTERPLMFKMAMINTLQKLFEEGRLAFSKYDIQFVNQLRDYRVIATTADGFKTTSKNEHIIDAFGLACYALSTNYMDQMAPQSSKSVAQVKELEVVRSATAVRRYDQMFKSARETFTDSDMYRAIGRGLTGTKAFSRTRF